MYLIEVEHKLQIDYQKTLRTLDTDIHTPIITIPIYIGEAPLQYCAVLSTAAQFNIVLSIIPLCLPIRNQL